MKHKIGIIGFGTVGKGVAEILAKNHNYFKDKYHLDFTLVAITDRKYGTAYNSNGLDLSAVLRSAIVDHKFTSELSNIKPDELISKSDVDTWCELTPTNLSNGLPALDYIKLALNAGKHVITTNKGPVSLYYNELKKLANEN